MNDYGMLLCYIVKFKRIEKFERFKKFEKFCSRPAVEKRAVEYLTAPPGENEYTHTVAPLP